MPYKSPGARRTANREAQRRRRAGQAAEVAAEVAEAAAVLSPGAVVGAPYRSPAGAPVSLGPGDGGRIAPGPPGDDLTDAPGAIEDGPAAPPVDDGEFVSLQHRCTTCGVVRDLALPPIEALGGFEVQALIGRCEQCRRTPDPDQVPAERGAVLPPAERGAVMPATAAHAAPYVEPLRPSRADVMRERLAGSLR